MISHFAEQVPDVVLMDLKMPVMDGIEATGIIHQQFPDVKVLVVTMYGEDKFITHLMEIGAKGYLLKNAEPDEIRRSIYAVYENGFYFTDAADKALLKKLSTKNNIKPSFNPDIELSQQEVDLLMLICEERTKEEIAKEISLSAESVEKMQQRLIEKVGVRNTAGLVMYAIKNGIVN